MGWTAESLREFEDSIRAAYERGEVKAALHLSRGNESQLIEIFKSVQPHDWKFCTYRSHYQALLSGVPEERVRAEIMAGHSINLNFPEYRFFTSSIVGGCLPIATGMALAIKRRTPQSDPHEFDAPTGQPHVWCFAGDMAASIGSFSDCARYATGFDLPITFVIEDNCFSTNTPTLGVWGSSNERFGRPKTMRYMYKREWPHSGFRV